MKPGNIPDTKSHDHPQSTPHTEDHASGDRTERNLEAFDDAESMSPADATRNYDDSQTAQGRSFAKNPSPTEKHNTVPEEVAHVGNLTSRTIHSDNQGISNHSATDESIGQEKVTSERPDSQAALNHSK